MPTTITTEELQYFPAEQIEFVVADAHRSAEELVVFLRSAGINLPIVEASGFCREILLDLGGYVRLASWESAGLSPQSQFGLASAHATLALIVDSIRRTIAGMPPLVAPGRIGRVVFGQALTRFAWRSRSDLGADIVLDQAEEDDFVDAMARFLWKHRHTAPNTHRGNITHDDET